MQINFKCDSIAIVKALDKASKFLGDGYAVPVLENFFLEVKEEVLLIAASDSNKTFSTSIAIEQPSQKGTFTVSKKIWQYLKTLTSQKLTFCANFSDPKNTFLTISHYKGEVKGECEEGKEFRILEVPTVEEVGTIKSLAQAILPAENISIIFKECKNFYSKDELRPAMQGANLVLEKGSYTISVTNGHIVYTDKRTDEETFLQINDTDKGEPKQVISVIIPADFCNFLAGYKTKGSLMLSITDTKIFVKLGEKDCIYTSLIIAKFPDIYSVIPDVTKMNNSLKVEKAELLETISRLALCANENTKKIVLNLAPDKVQLSAENEAFGLESTEKLFSHYEGEPIKTAFNFSYLSDVAKSFGDNEEFTIYPQTTRITVFKYRKKIAAIMPVLIEENKKVEIVKQIKPIESQQPAPEPKPEAKEDIASATGLLLDELAKACPIALEAIKLEKGEEYATELENELQHLKNAAALRARDRNANLTGYESEYELQLFIEKTSLKSSLSKMEIVEGKMTLVKQPSTRGTDEQEALKAMQERRQRCLEIIQQDGYTAPEKEVAVVEMCNETAKEEQPQPEEQDETEDDYQDPDQEQQDELADEYDFE